MKFKRTISLILIILILASPSNIFASSDYPQIKAKAAIVVDYDTGEILFEKNIKQKRSVASMAKVMTALLVFEAIERGDISWHTMVPISEFAKNSYHWAKTPFKAQHTMDELIHLILIESNNQAAIAVAEFMGNGSIQNFVQQMNSKAKELGFEASYTDPVGLTSSSVTATAQAQLIQYFILNYPHVLDITSQKYYMFEGSKRLATNKFLTTFYNYRDIRGFKTGTTPEAGQCISTFMVHGNKKLISVVLGSSGKDGRYLDTMEILDFAVDSIENGPKFYVGNTSDWAKYVIAPASEGNFNTALLQGKRSFDGKEKISRAEFIAMLALVLKIKPINYKSSFTDVDINSWYGPYVEAAYQGKFVQGVGGGLFDPQSDLTREQMALMLQNALRLAPNLPSPIFKDMNKVGKPYYEAVLGMAEHKIVQGTELGTFNPQGTATREETTLMIYNLQKNLLQ